MFVDHYSFFAPPVSARLDDPSETLFLHVWRSITEACSLRLHMMLASTHLKSLPDPPRRVLTRRPCRTLKFIRYLPCEFCTSSFRRSSLLFPLPRPGSLLLRSVRREHCPIPFPVPCSFRWNSDIRPLPFPPGWGSVRSEHPPPQSTVGAFFLFSRPALSRAPPVHSFPLSNPPSQKEPDKDPL